MKIGDLVRFKSAVGVAVGLVWEITEAPLTKKKQIWVLYRESDPPAWAHPDYLEVINESR